MPQSRNIGHDAKAIANHFLDLADQEARPINMMHLQKLLYNAHGYHLAMLNEPLFWQTVYAWKYGPVIADVYYEFNDYELDPIESRAVYFDEQKGEEMPLHANISPETADLIRRLWYGHKDADPYQLAKAACGYDTPWAMVTDGHFVATHSGVPIPNHLIREYYSQFVNKHLQVDDEQYVTTE